MSRLRDLGATGLRVGAITLGGAPLGSVPQDFGHEVLDSHPIPPTGSTPRTSLEPGPRASPEVKQRGAAAVVARLTALGLKRDDVLVAIHDNGDGGWYAPSEQD